MSASKPIYVETFIHTEMESIWRATQDPAKHEEWDLRFSKIEYIPKEDEEEKQRFRYVTNIGFGLRIEGEGVTTPGKYQDQERMSALLFSSDQAISLIQSGGGYWRYIQEDQGVRFLTRYDYKTRFYFLGKWFDRMIFRPLMGWATALSFDVLKIWLEKGIPPKVSYRQLLIHAIVTFGLMFTWIYHGLVPKLLTQDAQELALLKGSSVRRRMRCSCCRWWGCLKLLLGSYASYFTGKRHFIYSTLQPCCFSLLVQRSQIYPSSLHRLIQPL